MANINMLADTKLSMDFKMQNSHDCIPSLECKQYASLFQNKTNVSGDYILDSSVWLKLHCKKDRMKQTKILHGGHCFQGNQGKSGKVKGG